MASALLTADDLGVYLQRRQGARTATEFAANLGISRQYMRLIQSGEKLPSRRILDQMGIDMILQHIKTRRLMLPADLARYIARQQGKLMDKEFAAKLGLTRQHYYLLKHGLNAVPAPATLEKIGMRIMYRPRPKAKNGNGR